MTYWTFHRCCWGLSDNRLRLLAAVLHGYPTDFSCSVLKELQRKDCMLLIDSMWLTGYRGSSAFFAACTRWPNILQQSRLNDVYSGPLAVSLTLFSSRSLYLFLFTYFPSASLFLSSHSLSLSAPAGQTGAELLQKRSIVRYGTAS